MHYASNYLLSFYHSRNLLVSPSKLCRDLIQLYRPEKRPPTASESTPIKFVTTCVYIMHKKLAYSHTRIECNRYLTTIEKFERQATSKPGMYTCSGRDNQSTSAPR